MRLLLGIDGGQSSTVGLLAEEFGRIRARAVGPPADLVGEPRDSRRRAEVLEAVAASARVQAGLPTNVAFAAVVAGLSGHDPGEPAPPPPRLRAARLLLVHDAETAHVGAFDGGDGIVVVAGTGSVALGVAGEVRARAGGWGYLFGDAGGAFAIARAAVVRAMEAEDRGRALTLGEAALRHAGAPTLRALQAAFAHGDLSRPALAAFARTVAALATDGDDDARKVVAEAAVALARLVETVDARLPATSRRDVAGLGGVFRGDAVRRAFEAEVAARLPHARLMPPRRDAAFGALILAFREAALPVPRFDGPAAADPRR